MLLNPVYVLRLTPKLFVVLLLAYCEEFSNDYFYWDGCYTCAQSIIVFSLPFYRAPLLPLPHIFSFILPLLSKPTIAAQS